MTHSFQYQYFTASEKVKKQTKLFKKGSSLCFSNGYSILLYPWYPIIESIFRPTPDGKP